MSEKISTLINRVGVPLVYSAKVNDAGSHVDAEVTTASAAKLTELLGEKHVKFLRFKGTHVVVRVTVAELETAVANAKQVVRGAKVSIAIVSRMVYDIAVTATEGETLANAVTSAWWEAEANTGGIVVNAVEYKIYGQPAHEVYTQPPGDAGKEWNPERTVYVVNLPTAVKSELTGEMVAGEMQLSAYGITNLINRVCKQRARIG